VTQGQWEAVMGTRPWKGQGYVKQGSNYPATHVSWDDAVAFCRRLSEKESVTYRLPTEAEWEYACRAETTTKFSFGDDEKKLGDHAWFGGLIGDGNAKNERYAHQVGTKRPNAWGLYDMHGNVWEWCQDRSGRYVQRNLVKDPSGPSEGSLRVSRGGSWGLHDEYCQSGSRNAYSPRYRDDGSGFRVVQVPLPIKKPASGAESDSW